MRLKYTNTDFTIVYERIVKEAEYEFSRKNFSDGIKYIQCAAEYQYNLNFRFSDARLDDLIIQLSDRLVQSIETYKPKKDNVIIYDCFALDSRGLTQQYLDALCYSDKYNIMLLHETSFSDKSADIINYCATHGVRTEELGNCSFFEKEEKLLRLIKDFRPEKVLYHLTPWSILPLSTFYAFKQIISYQINLTDHAFWLGPKLIDFSFEFRNFGAVLSIDKRKIKQEQILLQPYYPWTEDKPFQGFPELVNGKVICFAGGWLYKTEGDNGMFYEIAKRILEENPNTIFLYAGDGDRSNVNKFIKDNHFENRYLLLGNRTDINEVIKHIDIYINTYPIIGGLMSQFAAINGKPILTYKTKQVEDVVCQKGYSNIVFDTADELIHEANRLINDIDYRAEQGDIMRSLVTTQDDFRISFSDLFESDAPQNKIAKTTPDLEYLKSYPERVNSGENGLGLENIVNQKCPQALCWKMRFNLLWPQFRHKVHVFRMKLMGKIG